MADQIVQWALNDLIDAARLNDYRAHSLHVQPATAALVGLKVWGRDGGLDVADLIQARSHADADLFAIEDDGSLRIVGTGLYFNAANNRLGINVGVAPGYQLDVTSAATSVANFKSAQTTWNNGSVIRLASSVAASAMSLIFTDGTNSNGYMGYQDSATAANRFWYWSANDGASQQLVFTQPGVLRPGTDAYDLGTAALRWDLFGADIRSYSAASEANPTIKMVGGVLSFGLNSADALSVSLSAGAANRLDLATGDSLNVVNGSILAGTDGIDLGTAALRWDLFTSDVRSYSAASEANPTVRINVGGVFFGLNSADNLSVKLSAGAANRLDLATGDSFNIVAGNLTVDDGSLTVNQRGTGDLLITFDNFTGTGGADTRVRLDVGGPTSGDPQIEFQLGGVTAWSIGMDNTDADALVIAESTDLGTNNDLKVAAGGAVSILRGDLDVSRSQAGANIVLSIDNASNAAATEGAMLLLDVGGSSAGDDIIQLRVGGTAVWTFGLDNSDSDAWVLSEASALGTSNRLRVATGGGAVSITGSLQVDGAVTLGDAAADVITIKGTPANDIGSFQRQLNSMSIPALGSADLTITWPTAWGDTSYKYWFAWETTNGTEATDITCRGAHSKLSGSVLFRFSNANAVSARTVVVTAMGWND